MLADGPTTGGYPKIATVIASDLALLAQFVPRGRRSSLRFDDPARLRSLRDVEEVRLDLEVEKGAALRPPPSSRSE